MTPDNGALRSQVAALERKVASLSEPPSPHEADEMAAAQRRADSIAAFFGEHASGPVTGESALAYRKRLLRPLLPHSARLKDVRLDSVNDAAVMTHIEDIAYGDAKQAAIKAAEDAGRLLAITERDASGRLITKFHGDNMAWMAPFMTGGQCCTIKEPK